MDLLTQFPEPVTVIGANGNEYDAEYFVKGIGVGWEPIVRQLILDLIGMGWNKHLYQVKEKFGGLRFYIGVGSEEIHRRIDEAEHLSYKICQNCGATDGVTTEGDWILTLCQPCRIKRG